MNLDPVKLRRIMAARNYNISTLAKEAGIAFYKNIVDNWVEKYIPLAATNHHEN